MAVNFDKFYSADGHIGAGRINLEADTFKAVLTNTAPNLATDDKLADLTQIPAGNGYTTGGVTLTSVTWTSPGADGKWLFTSAAFRWDVTGAPMAQFRYIVIYSDTSIGKKLVGRHDFGTQVTIPDGSYFRVDPATNGIFWLGKKGAI